MSDLALLRRAALGCCLLACSSSPSEPTAISSQLPAGFVARAGRDLISSASVARIAQVQELPLAQALSLAVSDALFAEAARASALPGTASHIDRAAAARSLLEHLARDAARSGPPSEVELQELVRDRWADVDRPDAVRTSHAVVINDKPERATEARRVAEKVAEAVKPGTSAEEFARLAQAVAVDGLQLKVEPLLPVTSDGRTFEQRDGAFLPRGTFDLDFARAANALTVVGQLSPVTQSKFGYHVIRLEERVPGRVVPKSELANLLGPEVLTRRAARARRELLEQLRKGVAIEVDRGVDELTARPKVAP